MTLVRVTDVYGRHHVIDQDALFPGARLLKLYTRAGKRLRERDSRGRLNAGHGAWLHRDNIDYGKGTHIISTS